MFNQIKTKSIQTIKGKTINLDVSKASVKPQFTQHSKYHGRTVLDWDQIYVPDENRGQITNSIRKGGNVDNNRVSEIETDIDTNGIRYEEPIIAIYKEPINVNNRHYEYQIGNVGNHRGIAQKRLGIKSWIFDVYDPADIWATEDTGWDSNNSKSNVKPLKKDDMINSLVKMVRGNRWGEDKTPEELELIIVKYIKQHASSNTKTIESIIKQVLHKTNTKTDHRDYLPEQAERFVEKTAGVEVNGVLDEDTDRYHWVVGEGYEGTKILKAILKFKEDEKQSDFYLHQKQPLTSSKKRKKDTTYKKRKSQVKTFNNVLEAIEKVVEWKQKNGKWPLFIKQFLPHDAILGEDFGKFVSPVAGLTKPTNEVNK
tara:strand:+ start:118 stop:1227 length:1110 start_codon:yes stop_codon:yes gene_type:complete